MSLKPSPVPDVPKLTAQIAREAFPKGNTYLRLRDELGSLYRDEDFTDLYPTRGQPAYAPWRLALITVFQFMENLTDRQAATAVRARIDWKYALSLEPGDSGFHYSVLSEFRTRLVEGGAKQRLLEKILSVLIERGIVKRRGRQRTDATHVLGHLRELNRIELLGETMRAALNEIARVDPESACQITRPGWLKRYGPQVIERRLPNSKTKRKAYAEEVGADGFYLLLLLESKSAAHLRELPAIATLRKVWTRHFAIDDEYREVRLKTKKEVSGEDAAPESPYETEARYRSLSGKTWTGYMVHLTETCDDNRPRIVTNVQTTPANIHEATRTESIHEDLAAKDLTPAKHIVDSGYMDADHVIDAKLAHDIHLVGPMRKDNSWQARTEGGYTADRFTIDWEQKKAVCPEGKTSRSWGEYSDEHRGEYISVRFSPHDCQRCPAKEMCTRSKTEGRAILLQPRAKHEALTRARAFMKSAEGRTLSNLRRGVESSISQGVRAFGLRRARYRGKAKTHLQHVAGVAAMNIVRAVRYLEGAPMDKAYVPPLVKAAA